MKVVHGAITKSLNIRMLGIINFIIVTLHSIAVSTIVSGTGHSKNKASVTYHLTRMSYGSFKKQS